MKRIREELFTKHKGKASKRMKPTRREKKTLRAMAEEIARFHRRHSSTEGIEQ